MSGKKVLGAQRGSSRLKAIFGLAMLIIMFYVGFRVIPVLLNEYEFQDSMQSAARLASATRQTPDDIRSNLVKEAQSDDIPLKPEDIHVEAQSGNVHISASYSVTVDLQVYQWTFNFNPTASNGAI